ncbi:MAG: Hpt domain-containing protein [Xanthobacteraceae bacterium]
MSKSSQAQTEETHYEDHSVIMPPHRLKTAVIHTSEPGEIAMDVIEKAEAALAALKDEFGGWMDSECERLEAARQALHYAGASAPTIKMLFLASHDVKGDAATLGFPLAGRLAGSLCRLLDHAPDPKRCPVVLIDRHVEAIRAVVRESVRDMAQPVGAEVSEQLAILVEKFLASELKDDYAEIAGEAYVQIELPTRA